MTADRTPTTQRVLGLLDLLQRRAVWTGPELAAELGVTTRSVRRDVDRLRDLGYPVESERGAGGGYRLGSGRRLPPLLLDDREAVAVAIALRLAAGGAVAGVGEHALGALTKLDQVMPGRLRERVADVSESMVAVPGTDTPVEPALLMELGHAVRGSEQVRLDYRDRAGRDTERRVEPYRIVVLGRRWYLLSYDLERADWRTFRLDRIRAVHRSRWRFTPRPDVPDPATHVQHSVTTAPYEHRASVVVQATARDVRECFPPTFGTVTELRPVDHPDGPACRLETGAAALDELAWYLGRLPAPFVVESPDGLRGHLAALADRLAAAAAGPHDDDPAVTGGDN
ncbi:MULTISPECIES: YafY family protein [unclassified Dietzia]|uniref:helix-turn-helix transcriptional regulator n=4 Tax=Dietzia TaxID=37914 RepID=UPI000D222961|nr:MULTISPECIES: YafY family protein [unclassified Dietzia]AVZ40149.1 transcriptional regulator [Dietzia sp. JS16-p6b]